MPKYTEDQLAGELSDREAKLAELSADLSATQIVPVAYVVTIELPDAAYVTAADSFTEPTVQFTGTATVKQQSVFYCKRIDFALSAFGTLDDPVVAAKVTLSSQYYFIAGMAEFLFKICNTGSDQEWQNTWLPSRLLQSGDCNGLLFDDSHRRLSGGSRLDVTVGPLNVANTALVTGMSVVTSWSLQFMFSGVERRL